MRWSKFTNLDKVTLRQGRPIVCCYM